MIRYYSRTMECIHLPYAPDSSELFSHFVHLPYAVWLDSGHPHTQQGRYDIISATPAVVLQANERGTLICTETDTHQSTDDIFRVTQNQLQHLPVKNNLSLPFTVGAIGYCAYDLSWQFEKLPTIATRDIDLPTGMMGIYHWSIVVDHVEQQTMLVADTPATLERVQHYLSQTPNHHEAFSLTEPFTTNLPFDVYRRRFQRLQQHIYDGDCYEANLCQRFSAQFRGSSWEAYRQLRRVNAAPFSSFINLPYGSILSCSPERFLQIQNGIVETKPIKGTTPRFKDPDADRQSAEKLLSSEKDKAENLMIVDLLRNDLGKCCVPGSIKVPKLFSLESFTNVHHLVSTVTGTLKDEVSALDLWRACFPGGSITGAPKIRAMEIIESLEPHHRSIYCGSIGYIDVNGNMDSNITIRTAICNENNIYCYGGGAIVSDSNAEAEYAESRVKVQKMMDTLALSEAGSIT